LASVSVATGLSFVLAPHTLSSHYVAVLVSATYGNTRAGMLSLALSTVVVEYVFLPPTFRVDLGSEGLRSLLLFLVVSGILLFLAHRLRSRDAAARYGHRLLADVIDSAMDAIVILDEHGKVTVFNGAAERLFERRCEEATGRPFRGLLSAPVDGPNAPVDLASGRVTTVDVLRPDGSRIPVELSASETNGDHKTTTIILRDTRQRAEHEREIERLRRLYAALSQVNQAIVRVTDRQKLFGQIAEVLVTFGGFRLAWVSLFEPEGRRLVPVATFGPGGDALPALDMADESSVGGQTPSGQAFFHGKPHVSNDLVHDPRTAPWSDSSRSVGILSAAVFPIRCGGEVCGTLGVCAGELNFFQEAEVALLVEAASDMSFALDMLAFREDHARAEANAARLAAIVESTGDAVISEAMDGTITSWNPAATKLFGYSSEETVGHSMNEILPPSRLTPAERECLARVRSGEHVPQLESVRRRKDGTTFPVMSTISPLFGPDGKVTGISCISRDLSETKRAEQVAERERRFAELLLEVMPGTVVVHDETGRVIRWNDRFERVTGYSPDEIGKMDPLDFFVPSDREAMATRIRAVFTEGEATVEATFASKDGSTHPYFFTGRRVELDGRTCLLGVGIDIAERKRTEAQLIVSDRMASVGLLAAGVAHEINNPLAAVIANLELADQEIEALAEHAPVSVDLVEEVRDAREGAARVRTIVRDLKIFSRTERDDTGPVDAEQVIESTLRLARNELRHRARLERVFGEIPRVRANESRLGQVLLNLVVNAAQSIPEGDYEKNLVRIETALGPEGTVTISVTDTGSGIAPEIRGRLFTPFLTTKPVGVGTGLGLSICHRIVSGFGGSIDFTTETGVGTTFRVHLPVADGVALTSRRALPSRPVTRRMGRVLVVDDEPTMHATIRRILAHDHEVEAVSKAVEAISLFRSGARFDVVLCDVMMPQTTGVDLYRALQDIDPAQAARVVFMTGGAFTPTAREFLDTSKNRRIEKPFQVEGLRALVDELVADRNIGQ
jgi:PAS domain S-box-containing protein